MRPRSLLLVAALVAAPAARAQAPDDRFVGSWRGTLQTASGVSLRIGFDVQREPDGALGGSMVSIDQGGIRLPVRLALRGDTLVAAVPDAQATFTAVAARDSLVGRWAQGAGSLPLALGRVAASGTAVATLRRPQEPKPPFPYRTEEVAVASVAGVRLAGTLTLPEGRGPFPAVVLVSGSGPQDRDETLLGHRPFAVLADHLARRGIATLRYDDRGTARSTGDFAAATSADFADDAEAAVRWLRARPEVARDRVGIAGHSEGGLVAPLVAARTRDVAFIVLLAGPGLPGDSILLLQQGLIARAQGMPAPTVDQLVATNRRFFAAVRAGRDSADAARRVSALVDEVVGGLPEGQRDAQRTQLGGGARQLLAPWMRWFIAHDPRPALRRVQVPVLALNGALDLQVPPRENLEAIGAALREAGNRDVTLAELPQLNHLFQTARTGAPSEYATITETFAPAALERVSTWILERFGRR
jgi:hypothetical protein